MAPMLQTLEPLFLETMVPIAYVGAAVGGVAGPLLLAIGAQWRAANGKEERKDADARQSWTAVLEAQRVVGAELPAFRAVATEQSATIRQLVIGHEQLTKEIVALRTLIADLRQDIRDGNRASRG